MISNGISLLLGQSPKFLPWLFIHHQWFFTVLGKERGHRLAIKPWWKLCSHSLENCSHSHSHTHPLWWAVWGGSYPPNTSQLEPPPPQGLAVPSSTSLISSTLPLTLCPLSFLIPLLRLDSGPLHMILLLLIKLFPLHQPSFCLINSYSFFRSQLENYFLKETFLPLFQLS